MLNSIFMRNTEIVRSGQNGEPRKAMPSYDIDNAGGKLNGKQAADVAYLELAGAVVRPTISAKEIQYDLIFSRSHEGDEPPIITLREKTRGGRRTSWQVRSSDGSDYIRVNHSVVNIIGEIENSFRSRGFRVETEILLETGATNLLVQFPAKGPRFEPQLILHADSHGRPIKWQVCR